MENSRTVVEYIPLPPPPWEISTDIAPTPMEVMGGEFAIQTYLKGRYLTAVGGGQVGRRDSYRRDTTASLGGIQVLGR